MTRRLRISVGILLIGLLVAGVVGPWAARSAEKKVLGYAFAADAVGMSEELGVDWGAEREKAYGIGFAVGAGVPLLLAAATSFWVYRRRP